MEELEDKIKRLEREYNKTILLYDAAVDSGESDETVSELFEKAVDIHRDLLALYDKLYLLDGSDGKD